MGIVASMAVDPSATRGLRGARREPPLRRRTRTRVGRRGVAPTCAGYTYRFIELLRAAPGPVHGERCAGRHPARRRGPAGRGALKRRAHLHMRKSSFAPDEAHVMCRHGGSDPAGVLLRAIQGVPSERIRALFFSAPRCQRNPTLLMRKHSFRSRERADTLSACRTASRHCRQPLRGLALRGARGFRRRAARGPRHALRSVHVRRLPGVDLVRDARRRSPPPMRCGRSRNPRPSSSPRRSTRRRSAGC